MNLDGQFGAAGLGVVGCVSIHITVGTPNSKPTAAKVVGRETGQGGDLSRQNEYDLARSICHGGKKDELFDAIFGTERMNVCDAYVPG